MEDNTTPEDISLARNRSRRTKTDKTGRLAALQRLKQAKESGERLTYEVKDEDDVYEEVDEATYSKIVRDRQEDDWIIDDDGSGYVEDGRDIFDEDGTGDAQASKGKKGASEKRKKNPNIRAPGSKPKNIRSMFAAAAVKAKPKPEKDVNLNEDELLGDIMAELHNDSSASLLPAPVKLKKKTPAKPAFNPFSTKVTPKKPPAKLLTPRNINNDLPNKVKKTKLKAPVKTALDNLDSEPQILEYETQDFAEALDENMELEDEKPKVKEEENGSTEPDVDDPNNSVLVDDIDFDDDMEEEAPAKAKSEEPKIKSIPEFSGWDQADKGDMDVPVDVHVDSSQLPLTTNDDGEQVLRMYWLDAYEDPYRQPGTVYLFGKVWIDSAKTHVSACVAVRNIQRRIFILPRKFRYNLKTKTDMPDPVTCLEVYQEFSEQVTERYKINNFKSMKVTKEYAFEKIDVPAESDYLEVRYSAEYPTLPMDLKGETFSHVFGSNTSCLELFLLDRKMKGPSWIDIKLPQIPNPTVSWCKVEAFVNSPNCVNVTPSPPAIPPFVVMTLKLLTMTNPKTHQNEILGAACLVQHKFQADKSAPKPHFQQHFCVISKPNNCVFPYDFKEKVQKKAASMKVEVASSERALLGFLLAKIHKVDPDVIAGHDIFAFDMDVLLHRFEYNKIPHWSRIGRLKRANIPKFTGRGKGGRTSAATSGRLITDVMISAKELIRCRSYDLTELVSHVLKEKREDIDMDLITTYYNSSSTLLQLVEHTLMDANFALRMMYDLMVIPLALSITNICGNIMNRTLLGGRSERNEYLLLHAFTEKNFVVPDKTYAKKPAQPAGDGENEDEDGHNTTTSKRTGRKKPAYEGGLVLEPKKGFYDKYILLLDFNSLYPSIIQEYNICFTTITRNANDDQGDELEIPEVPDQDLEPGILPTEIRKLVQSRRQVKQLMKAPDLSHDLMMQYDIRQKALKLTANSMYGCLGFTFSRFYAKPLAALVTGKGREILMKTKDLVEAMSLDVIYGDTDSIMINTNSTDLDEVFKMGNKVKNEVNKLYKLLEIDIDGVFKSMLLLKKKKYAALTVSKQGDKIVTAQELKGLDIVRRDWCTLAKEAGNFVVSQILSGDQRENIVENIHSKLIEVGEQVKENKLPVELYHITKSLTKNPEDYPDKKSLPHVQVALRLNSKGGRKMRAGDTIYYVICEDGSNLAASQRAYHPDELDKSDNLKIDTKYYLSNQVHPVISRLCDPIDGTDAAHIAECLGLDPTGYRQAMARSEQTEDEAMLGGAAVSDEERYKDCDRLKFPCPTCSKEIILDSVFTGVPGDMELALAKCTNQTCSAEPISNTAGLMNLITRLMREHIKKYYEGWLHCDDAACALRTKNLPLIFIQAYPACPQCRKNRLQPEYTDSALYTQLCFYQSLFDLERALNNITSEREKNSLRERSRQWIEEYKKVKCHVEKQVRGSAYSEVNLGRIFDCLHIKMH